MIDQPASKLRPMLTSTAVILTLLLAAMASCNDLDPPKQPSVHDKLVEAGLADHVRRPKLRIGISDAQPLMGYTDAGVHRGFDTDIARYIAASLGYPGESDIEWVTINNTRDKIQYLQNGRVDLVVASFSITKERAEQVNFAGPYFITEQRVMIRAELSDEIATIEDLQQPKHRICTSTGSTSERLLNARNVRTTPLDTVRQCVEGMVAGKYDATSTDRTILAGFMSRNPDRFKMLDLNLAMSDNATEQLGIGVSKSNPALRDLVNFFLRKSYRAQEAGEATAWQIAYNNSLGPWYGWPPATQPPIEAPDLLDFDEKAPAP